MMPKASLAPCMIEDFPQFPEGIVGIKNSLQSLSAETLTFLYSDKQ